MITINDEAAFELSKYDFEAIRFALNEGIHHAETAAMRSRMESLKEKFSNAHTAYIVTE